MKRNFLLALFFFAVSVQAQEIRIVPQPVQIIKGKGSLLISGPLKFTSRNAPEGIYSGINYFKNYLATYYSFTQFADGNGKNNASTTEIIINYKKGYSPTGGYRLEVDSKNIRITGDENGIFAAFQTLIQLLPLPSTKAMNPGPARFFLPQVSVTDYPRFQYRGMHLDVCRHFFPVSFVKQYIDYLALHKLNTFHWHLTDDQGWRIELKKYPKLTSIGAWRNGTIIGRYPGTGNDNQFYGGFYSQEEIKEVVEYAKERYIDVIPEIEMPGHSSAAIAAYPWLSCFPGKPTAIPANMISSKSIDEQKNGRIKLVQETWGVFDDVFCAGNDSTFMFLENVLDEVISLFPSKYIHIGGDECPKTHWKICPKCQKRIKELGLKDEHELQSYFIQRIEKYLNSKGKRIIGWDEILEGGLAPDATVMSWRGEQGGIDAAKQQHDVIMTPGNPVYFDHSQSENEDSVTIGGYNPIEKVYAYEPIPKELSDDEGKHVLGAQANLWTEYIDNPQKVEYMVFPRMAALSEILWSPKEKKDWKGFEKRLPAVMSLYDVWKVNYSKAYYDLKTSVTPTKNHDGIEWHLQSKYGNLSQIKFFGIKQLKQDKSNRPIYNEYDPTPNVKYPTGKTIESRIQFNNGHTGFLFIDQSGLFSGYAYKVKLKDVNAVVNPAFPVLRIQQQFNFSKATGKQITLTNPASKNYPGDGAFTLVNGVINEKGMARSKEFLGFTGTNCEAIIDLGKSTEINSATVHCFERISSWIWKPTSAEVLSSTDGQHWQVEGQTNEVISAKDGKGMMKMDFNPVTIRYVKFIVKNQGIIPDGNPGAGQAAWLFVDELAVY